MVFIYLFIFLSSVTHSRMPASHIGSHISIDYIQSRETGWHAEQALQHDAVKRSELSWDLSEKKEWKQSHFNYADPHCATRSPCEIKPWARTPELALNKSGNEDVNMFVQSAHMTHGSVFGSASGSINTDP